MSVDIGDTAPADPETAIIPIDFQLTTRHDGDGAAIVVGSGELDIATAPRLAAALLDRHDGAAEVVVDLSAVTFIDSTGLHTLLTAHERLGERMRIIASPACERVMALAGVTEHLPLVSPDRPPR